MLITQYILDKDALDLCNLAKGSTSTTVTGINNPKRR